jgi:membrane protein DedA with SNARE-associated domain
MGIRRRPPRRRASGARSTGALTVGAPGAMSASFLFVQIDYRRVGDWGYLGIFGVVFIATASFVLPTPYLLIIARAGTLLHPWLVAAVAGLVRVLGETTGYLVGLSGNTLIPRGRWYDRSRAWICPHGFWCVASFSCVPNPFFNAMGLAASVLCYSA